MRGKNIVYCNKLVYLHVNTGENLSLDKINSLKSDNEVLQFLKKNDTISTKFLKIFEMRYRYQIGKYGKESEKLVFNPYPLILNMWKIYGMLLTVINRLIGNKVPVHTDDA